MTKNEHANEQAPLNNVNDCKRFTFQHGDNNTSVNRSVTVNLVFFVDTPPADVPAIVRAVLDGLAGNRGGGGE